MIVLNGGTSDDLAKILDEFQNRCGDTHAYGSFSEPGIGDALTCVGLIADERLLLAKAEIETKILPRYCANENDAWIMRNVVGLPLG